MSKNLILHNPSLMLDWDWEKNNAEALFPEKLTCGSSKKAWWKCHVCAHSWKTKVSHRNSGSACPNCSNKSKTNPKSGRSLRELSPVLCQEWNYEKNDESPDSYSALSNKKVWWTCHNRHEWQATISHRFQRNDQCPICANKLVIKGINDISTTHPQIAKEWDFLENSTVDIFKISKGSHKKVWWSCQYGHKWQAAVYSRTILNNNGCPYCSKESQTSYFEKAIFFYLTKSLQDVKILENFRPDFLQKSELDIYIPSLKLGIEYDGAFWHQDLLLDAKKDALCQENNLTLIRIREPALSIYKSDSIKIQLEQTDPQGFFLEAPLRELLRFINERYALNATLDFDISRDQYEIEKIYRQKVKNQSIATSNFISQWNKEKNNNLDPSKIPLFSNKKYWWTCSLGHNWEASAAHRASGQNCPFCSNQKVLQGYNDLQTQYPNLASEWDFSKNNISPNKVLAKSNQKYWWKCKKCGHEWLTPVYVRSGMGCNCPKCSSKSAGIKRQKRVLNIDLNKEYDSVAAASKDTGINIPAIRACCLGINKTSGGYHWKYIEPSP